MKIIYTKEELGALQDMKDTLMDHADEIERKYSNEYIIEDLEEQGFEVAILSDGSVELSTDSEFTVKALRAYTKVLDKGIPLVKKIAKAVEPLLELLDSGILKELKGLYTYFEEQVSEVLEEQGR